VGSSSKNIKQTAAFGVRNDIIVEKDHKVLTPQIQINELKPANTTGFIYELNNFAIK
jgi:hypothetical protein